MAVTGWVLDKSAAARAGEPKVGSQLAQLAGTWFVCPTGELEQLYSARSARHYDELKAELHASFAIVPGPPDLLERALRLQQDLTHHHGMWHRTPFPTSSSLRPRSATALTSYTLTVTSTASPRSGP